MHTSMSQSAVTRSNANRIAISILHQAKRLGVRANMVANLSITVLHKRFIDCDEKIINYNTIKATPTLYINKMAAGTTNSEDSKDSRVAFDTFLSEVTPP